MIWQNSILYTVTKNLHLQNDHSQNIKNYWGYPPRLAANMDLDKLHFWLLDFLRFCKFGLDVARTEKMLL